MMKIGQLQEYLANNPGHYDRYVILADSLSRKFCHPVLLPVCPMLVDTPLFDFPHGEENKTLETASRLLKELLKAGYSRNTLLINLGGGVVTDMGGFVASVYKRGIHYINIPTTLLAMVDASSGGKTGVNMDHYKNMIGTFYPPQAVFIDPVFLNTLDQRNLVSGYAEVLKHALIADPEYFRYLYEYPGMAADWERVIEWSVRIKQKFIDADPYDRGMRKALNFGHTIGHALETLSLGNEAILHGEAVAAGMICETWLSHRNLGLPFHVLETIAGFIARIFPAIKIKKDDYERLYQVMKQDKKNDGSLRFVLLQETGRVAIDKVCSREEVFESFDFYNNLIL